MTIDDKPTAGPRAREALGNALWVAFWALAVGVVGDMWLRQTVHSAEFLWFPIVCATWSLPNKNKPVRLAHLILAGAVVAGWTSAVYRFGSEAERDSAWTTICIFAGAAALGLLLWLWDKNAPPRLKAVSGTAMITVLMLITALSVAALAGMLFKDIHMPSTLIDGSMFLTIVYLPLMGLGWWMWTRRKARKSS